MENKLKEFTREELAKYNGKEGQPVYVAYDGKVYDVSESKLWKTGAHMMRPWMNTFPTCSWRCFV
jgi:predicted heme/steroid binding protein